MFNILIVEDDKNLRKLIGTVLKQNGFNVLCANDGEQALEVLDSTKADLIICDIMMPNMDGYELTESLRWSNYNMPILMITAKETLEDKRKGFLSGADDYMVKPINTDEMLLRVNALLRRSKIATEHRIEVGDVIIDYDTLSVQKDTERIVLPKKEFLLLFKLMSYPKKIFTRQQLMDDIWGLDSETDERTVDVHIKRLREKLVNIDEFEIVTVRGLGYKAEKKNATEI
ncbi:MAG TPA: response regulator transcription factor [Clostridia bacterium]|jgi:two-component system OmpR family response regulator|nr:response regulator transcription factor [Clostridiaceae bacterium]HOF26269.1 response regulator transcription factor [Clostridia bacterium]HOM35047.1 response regulator transcription factor [Clostridia bacterium]HOR89555.1 response regulator transcription factor [Clostridia bacterium]HOT70039.1 response regulator transcription factor [Clostridia bacterium]